VLEDLPNTHKALVQSPAPRTKGNKQNPTTHTYTKLEIGLTKEAQTLDYENYKSLLKEIKENINGRLFMFMNQKI
jgi:hypothetical protein